MDILKNQEYRDPEMRKIYGRMKQCPISKTADLIMDKFTVLILRNMLYHNHTRFNQFLENIEDLHPKTLSLRLKQMEKKGLIKRKVHDETPIRIEYFPTDKGHALKSLIDSMAIYSTTHFSEEIFFDGKPKGIKNLWYK